MKRFIMKDKKATITLHNLTSISFIAAMYITLSLCFAPFSFGVIQIRLAELFNFLVLKDKRYIWGVTLGVSVVNFFSPNGIVDVIVGTLGTFFFLKLGLFLTKPIQTLFFKLVLFSSVLMFSMCTIALELSFLYQTPLWYNWGMLAIGEGLSLSIGGSLFYVVEKKGLFYKDAFL